LEHWIDEGEQPRTIETVREVRESGGRVGRPDTYIAAGTVSPRMKWCGGSEIKPV